MKTHQGTETPRTTKTIENTLEPNSGLKNPRIGILDSPKDAFKGAMVLIESGAFSDDDEMVDLFAELSRP